MASISQLSTKSLGDEHLLFSAVWTDIKMPSISCSAPAWWLIRLDMLRNGCHSSLPFCTSDKFRSRCLQMWTPLQLAGVKPWKETHKKSQETNESTESKFIPLGIHWNLLKSHRTHGIMESQSFIFLRFFWPSGSRLFSSKHRAKRSPQRLAQLSTSTGRSDCGWLWTGFTN